MVKKLKVVYDEQA